MIFDPFLTSLSRLKFIPELLIVSPSLHIRKTANNPTILTISLSFTVFPSCFFPSSQNNSSSILHPPFTLSLPHFSHIQSSSPFYPIFRLISLSFFLLSLSLLLLLSFSLAVLSSHGLSCSLTSAPLQSHPLRRKRFQQSIYSLCSILKPPPSLFLSSIRSDERQLAETTSLALAGLPLPS